MTDPTMWQIGREAEAVLLTAVKPADTTLHLDRPVAVDTPWLMICDGNTPMELVKITGLPERGSLVVSRGRGFMTCISHLAGSQVHAAWPSRGGESAGESR